MRYWIHCLGMLLVVLRLVTLPAIAADFTSFTGILGGQPIAADAGQAACGEGGFELSLSLSLPDHSATSYSPAPGAFLAAAAPLSGQLQSCAVMFSDPTALPHALGTIDPADPRKGRLCHVVKHANTTYYGVLVQTDNVCFGLSVLGTNDLSEVGYWFVLGTSI